MAAARPLDELIEHTPELPCLQQAACSDPELDHPDLLPVAACRTIPPYNIALCRKIPAPRRMVA